MCVMREKKIVHSVGFEPTSTNTFELESNSLDSSDKNAFTFLRIKHFLQIHCFYPVIIITTHYASHIVCGLILSQPFLHTQPELDKNYLSFENIYDEKYDNHNHIFTTVSI